MARAGDLESCGRCFEMVCWVNDFTTAEFGEKRFLRTCLFLMDGRCRCESGHVGVKGEADVLT